MIIKRYFIEGLALITPKRFGDDRGFFLESYKQSFFQENNLPIHFVQDNHSRSKKGVLRGLHYQSPPFDQGKLVRVSKGSVLDVAVDIRRESPTYGKWIAEELNDKNCSMLWVPTGFAHGFLTLEDDTDFLYKVTNDYSKEHEGGIMFNDSDLGIEWGMESLDLIVSDKDKILTSWKDFKSPF
ncbi:dTDP-4-dehydrorhamnose 3,5-epimerase [Leptospira sp. GIMC2001]|uniref:dTDP-4-dehydrorhamnose 3,5-epimerase n=1 Tax=Leptospira sp. GIMC2001 TaxID=1513297 RepID=UPI00234A0AA1|nr:dTDP-4-dehydrorhamnose 3,5-epimerase [Leptospira sp. GIMC2001]WCL51281.1 dTDP-4-dehydrorhamnose 3,5-epimerase [Leptospira sp. GIMC2001]